MFIRIQQSLSVHTANYPRDARSAGNVAASFEQGRVSTEIPSNTKEESTSRGGAVKAEEGISQKIQPDGFAMGASRTSEDLLNVLSIFFATDVEIKALLVLGMKKIGFDRLEKNFSVLLEDFAERLASEDNMHGVSQFASLQLEHILHIC